MWYSSCRQPFVTQLYKILSCKCGCNFPATHHGANPPTNCMPKPKLQQLLLYRIFKKVTVKGPINVYESCKCYFPVFHYILYVCDHFCSAVSVDSPGWLVKLFQCKGYNLLSSLIPVHLFLYRLQKWRTICLRLSIYSLPWFWYNVTLTSKFWVCTLLPGRLQIYGIDESLSTQSLLQS